MYVCGQQGSLAACHVRPTTVQLFRCAYWSAQTAKWAANLKRHELLSHFPQDWTQQAVLLQSVEVGNNKGGAIKDSGHSQPTSHRRSEDADAYLLAETDKSPQFGEERLARWTYVEYHNPLAAAYLGF